MFPNTAQTKRPYFVARLVFILFSSAYFIFCALYPNDNQHLIDAVNLIIHEAGHMVFGLFGMTISMAGGTILQLAVPALFTMYFFVRRAWYSGSWLLLWFGQSLINVSVYLKDAVDMRMPLVLGGGIHDWNYLLSKADLLSYTQPIGLAVYCFGFSLIILGALIGLFTAGKNELE